jgi:protein tyrosine/serine phosphatase
MDLHRHIAVASVLCLLPFSGCRIAGKNFHVVHENALYRSAQLERQELEQVIDLFKIKTVINLRGERPGAKWYDDELDVTSANGVELINIGMSPDRLPHKADLIQLLDSYRDAKRPILIHCQAGADRTGEAAAIYQMEYMGKSKSEASKMLSTKYKHYSILKPAKDYFIQLYQGESWARTVYDPCVQDYKYYDKTAFCEVSDPTQVPPQESEEEAEESTD